MSTLGKSTAPQRPSLQTEDHNSSPPLWMSSASLQGSNRSFQPPTTCRLMVTRKFSTSTLTSTSAPSLTTSKTTGQTSCRQWTSLRPFSPMSPQALLHMNLNSAINLASTLTGNTAQGSHLHHESNSHVRKHSNSPSELITQFNLHERTLRKPSSIKVSKQTSTTVNQTLELEISFTSL